MSTRHQETKSPEPKFPWLPLLAICCGMIAHSIMFTSPMPYVAFMVVDFGMVDNIDDAGYSAGWITGMFMLGRTISGIPWGLAADKWGRKPCLYMSMINIGVLGLTFGFSTNFTMAVTMRFFIGLGNGFMGVAKTCITELVSCKEHELRAFGLLNSVWGLGLIVGPALGGMLSRPAIQYPEVFSKSGLWGTYPYLLPSLVCSSIAFTACTLILIFLPETLNNSSKMPTIDSNNALNEVNTDKINEDNDSKQFGWNEARWKNSLVSSSSTTTIIKKLQNKMNTNKQFKYETLDSNDIDIEEQKHSDSLTTTITTEDDEGEAILSTSSPLSKSPVSPKEYHDSMTITNPILNNKTVDKDSDSNSNNREFEMVIRNNETNNNNDAISNNNEATLSKQSSKEYSRPTTFMGILQDKDLRFLTFIYMAYCFAIVFIDEVMPLWCVTSLRKGGLEWESAQVGMILATVGFVMIVFQLTMYEYVIKTYFNVEPVRQYFLLALPSSIFIMILPLMQSIALWISPSHNAKESKSNVVLYIFVMFCLVMYRVAAGCGFTTLGIVVNNSVDKKMRGTMNGLIMTAGSIGNATGPVIGSFIYAATLNAPKYIINMSPFPFDGRVAFVVGGLIITSIAFAAKVGLIIN